MNAVNANKHAPGLCTPGHVEMVNFVFIKEDCRADQTSALRKMGEFNLIEPHCQNFVFETRSNKPFFRFDGVPSFGA